MMMWQMLRRKIGNENFIAGVQLFYDNNKFQTASYSDMRKAMEEVSGLDLTSFFTQWVDRTGAPEIGIKEIKTDMFAGSKMMMCLILIFQ